MTNLIEFKVTKTLFDEVKNDQEFRFGFEAEFHVRNASSLLRDQAGRLPADFETYSTYFNSQRQQFDREDEISRVPASEFHDDTTLLRLCSLFQNYLGLPEGSITIEDTGYQKWKLMVDPSLYDRPAALTNPDHDMGVELISPILPLREGLAWMAKVCEMIQQFNYQEIDLYTTDLTSLHANLSHTRIGRDFDFAKLAILSGDEHYLNDFGRVKNHYTHPLLRAVYDLLVAVKQNQNPSAKATPALNLLNLRGWSPERVMTDLAALIPMDHSMSVDLRRLSTPNPYVEIRIAGNRGYEKRFDEIAALTIRFGALIKIACDPLAYREEYLKKIYQLVAGVTAQPNLPAQQIENPFPRARIFLSPIMSTATRAALDRMETYWRSQTLSIPNGSYLYLAIVRSAFDMRQSQSPRVRQGLLSLLQILKLAPTDLVKALKNVALLKNFGVIRPQDKNLKIVIMITNYVKSLHQPVTRSTLMNDANQQAREQEEARLLDEQAQRHKRAKKAAEQKLKEKKEEEKKKAARPRRRI